MIRPENNGPNFSQPTTTVCRPSPTAIAHIGYARGYAAEAKFDKAIPQYQAIIAQIEADEDTDDKQVIAPFALALADAYSGAKQYDLAQEQLNLVIKASADNPAFGAIALLKAGEVNIVQRNFRKSLAQFRQVLEITKALGVPDTPPGPVAKQIQNLIPLLESLVKSDVGNGEANDGKVTMQVSGTPNGGYPNAYVTTPSETPFAIAGQRQMLRDGGGGTGGPAEYKADGKVRFGLQWHRRTVNGAPDLTDNPPRYVYLSIKGLAKIETQDADGSSDARLSANETASATMTLEGPTTDLYSNDQTVASHASGAYTSASASLDRVIRMEVVSQADPILIWTPWITIQAQGNLAANRTYSQQTYPGYPPRVFWSNGTIRPDGTSWNTSVLNLTLTPSPNNQALMDSSGKALNQYTIDSLMPTSISVTSSDAGFTESLRAHSSWNLVGTAPALRPIIANVKEQSYGTAIIRPQHPALTAGGAPVNGLRFDVQTSDTPSTTSNAGWNFPADNDQFGVKTVNHVIGGTTTSAPVALFYPSIGFQHPTGGPNGYAHDQTTPMDTPNWVYYYDKAWKNPWGFSVSYWMSQNAGSLSTGAFDRRIYIGDEAHGLASNYRPTYLYAKVSSTSASQLAGLEDVRGLDTYVRIVTHEGSHILMAIAIDRNSYDSSGNLIDADGNGNPDVDNDDDHCPDVLEANAGLVVGDRNTNKWAGTSYQLHGDGESIATLYERLVTSSSTDDWADDGFNYGRPADIVLNIDQSGVKTTTWYTTPHRLDRIVRVMTYTGPIENLIWPSLSRDPLNQLLPPDLRKP